MTKVSGQAGVFEFCRQVFWIGVLNPIRKYSVDGKVNVRWYKGENEKVAVKIIPFDFVDSDNEIEL